MLMFLIAVCLFLLLLMGVGFISDVLLPAYEAWLDRRLDEDYGNKK